MKLIAAVPLTFLLVACATERQLATLPASHFGPKAETEAACNAAGGSWEGSDEIIVAQRCSVPTPDAGKVCRDHSDCAGLCIAPFGTKSGARTQGACYPSYNFTGKCLTRLSNGRAEQTLCVD